jgi:NADH:ubiquinone reductase (non-electrogenic)
MTRERVIVVGTGWAGFQLSQKLDDKKFDIVVISPEETSPYTPLLVWLLDYANLDHDQC